MRGVVLRGTGLAHVVLAACRDLVKRGPDEGRIHSAVVWILGAAAQVKKSNSDSVTSPKIPDRTEFDVASEEKTNIHGPPAGRVSTALEAGYRNIKYYDIHPLERDVGCVPHHTSRHEGGEAEINVRRWTEGRTADCVYCIQRVRHGAEATVPLR